MSEELDEAIRGHLELRRHHHGDAAPSADDADEWDFPTQPATIAARARPRDGEPVDWAELDDVVVEEPAPRATRVADDDIFSSIPLEVRRARRSAAREERRRALRTRRIVAAILALAMLGAIVGLLVLAVSAVFGGGGGKAKTGAATDRGSAFVRALPGKDVFPFPASPELRRADANDRLPKYWNDDVPCSKGCRAPGVVPGWPLQPFHSQHALRAGLNESRGTSFHHGIDIQARDGDPAYAIQPGKAHIIQATGPDSRVLVGNFIYWHIKPMVREGQQISPYTEVVGTITAGHKHLHLSEVQGGPEHYLNPLRPGGRALEPYVDTAPPVLDRPRIDSEGRVLIRAFDPQSFRVRTDYKTPVIAPAALGYRIFDTSGSRLGPVHWALRGSQNLQWTQEINDAVFAPSRQARGDCFNHELICKPDYDYVLAGGLAPGLADIGLTPGRYRLSSYAWDWAGNTTARDTLFDVSADATGLTTIKAV
jgi:murein DD-endopeptidase MepM/ murein hydrolase activator NlpD